MGKQTIFVEFIAVAQKAMLQWDYCKKKLKTRVDDCTTRPDHGDGSISVINFQCSFRYSFHSERNADSV